MMKLSMNFKIAVKVKTKIEAVAPPLYNNLNAPRVLADRRRDASKTFGCGRWSGGLWHISDRSLMLMLHMYLLILLHKVYVFLIQQNSRCRVSTMDACVFSTFRIY